MNQWHAVRMVRSRLLVAIFRERLEAVRWCKRQYGDAAAVEPMDLEIE